MEDEKRARLAAQRDRLKETLKKHLPNFDAEAFLQKIEKEIAEVTAIGVEVLDSLPKKARYNREDVRQLLTELDRRLKERREE